MPIVKWSPFLEPFDEMDKMLQGFDKNLQRGFAPAMDIYQDKKNVYVETPLAGVEPEKVDIEIVDDVLTLKGQAEKKSEVDEKNYYRKEVRSGSFYRCVALPAHVLGDKAKAESAEGMLKITIPKAPAKKAKSVKVKVSKTKKSSKK